MKRTKIVDALAKTVFGEEIDVKGWVRTHRSSKAVDFIALNDGSTIKNIQIVVDPDKFDSEMLKQIVLKACQFDPKARFTSAEEMLARLTYISKVPSKGEPLMGKR